MALCAPVHAVTRVLDRPGVNFCVPQPACTRCYGRDPTPNWDSDELAVRGVGRRRRASLMLHDVWVGLDAADCLTRYERTDREYIRVRTLF